MTNPYGASLASSALHAWSIAESGGEDIVAFGISAPGQGVDCYDASDSLKRGADAKCRWDQDEGHWIAPKPECSMLVGVGPILPVDCGDAQGNPANPSPDDYSCEDQEQNPICFDQISAGDSMWESPTEYTEGFPDDFDDCVGGTVNYEHSMLWNFTSVAARAVNLFDKVFDAGSDADLHLTNGQLQTIGYSAGAVTGLLLNTFDNRPLATIAVSGGGALWDVINQGGAWWGHVLRSASYGATYTPDDSLDCEDLASNPQSFSAADNRACCTGLYLDPTRIAQSPDPGFTHQNPVLLVSGALDEAYPVAGYRKTIETIGTQVDIERFLIGDLDHGYFIKVPPWRLQIPPGGIPQWNIDPNTFEVFGNFDPLSLPLFQLQFAANRSRKTIAAFYQRKIASQAYLPSPDPAYSDVDVETTQAGETLYHLRSCYPSNQSPAPISVRWNVSVDEFWHVLPACGGIHDNGRYIVTEDGTSSAGEYAYNEGCYESDAYIDKCVDPLWLDTRDVFQGVNQAISGQPAPPTGYTCRDYTIEFDNGTTAPTRFWAWPEFRYFLPQSGGKFQYLVTTGELIEAMSGEDPPLDSCIRPKPQDESMDEQINNFFLAGNYYDDPPEEPDDWISGYVVEFITDEAIEGAVVEAVNNETGESFATPVTAETDAQGDFYLSGIPDGVGVVGIKVSYSGHLDTYIFHRETGMSDFAYISAPVDVIEGFADQVSVDPDLVYKGVIFGYTIAVDDTSDEPIGCAEIRFETSHPDVYYAGLDGETPALTTLRDPGDDGPQTGEGTHPDVSGFFVFDVDPGMYLASASIPGHTIDVLVPAVPAGSLVEVGIEYRVDSVSTSNHTPGWCPLDTDLSGTIVDLFPKGLLEGVTVEAVSNVDGSSFDPQVTAETDANGYFELENIPESARERVAILTSLTDYLDTYTYHVSTRDDGGEFYLVGEDDMSLLAGIRGVTPDYENKGFMVGAAYYFDGLDYEPVGCAEAIFDPSVSSILYLYDDGYGLSTARDITSGGPYNGEGTWIETPVFVAFNMTPGEYDVDVAADGGTLEANFPDIPAGAVALTIKYFEAPEFEANPTGTWCTE